MLISIQNSIASILEENVKLKEDMAELKSSLRSNERKLKSLKEAVAAVTNKNVELTNEL